MNNGKPQSVGQYLRQKELAKQKDEQALRSGAKNPSEQKRENEHFAGLHVRIDFGRVKSPR